LGASTPTNRFNFHRRVVGSDATLLALGPPLPTGGFGSVTSSPWHVSSLFLGDRTFFDLTPFLCRVPSPTSPGYQVDGFDSTDFDSPYGGKNTSRLVFLSTGGRAISVRRVGRSLPSMRAGRTINFVSRRCHAFSDFELF